MIHSNQFDAFWKIITTPDHAELALFIFSLFSILEFVSPVYQKFKKDKGGFGTVFDSVTGKPIDLARIRLIDTHGLTTASAITDHHGHYRLAAAPGEYAVTVQKTGFAFPSRFLNIRNKSRTYDNVLASQNILIRDYGIITKNIPLDDENNQSKRSKVFSKWIALSDNTQLVIAYISPIFFLTYVTLRSSIVNWMVYSVFVSILLYRLYNFRPGRPQYGTVKDFEKGTPVQHAIIRLYDAKFNKVLQTQATSPKGRYAFLVNNGSYYMTVQKEGYRTMRLNFPNITVDSYPLATDIEMRT